MRKCAECKEEFPKTQEYFYKSKDRGRVTGYKWSSYCISCDRQRQIDYRSKRVERVRELGRKYAKNKTAKQKSRIKYLKYLNNILNKYKINEVNLRGLMDKQRGCCSICKCSLVFPYTTKTFSIDHCHDTGEVRGLLCNECNLGLGKFKESIDLLQNALSYLRSNDESCI